MENEMNNHWWMAGIVLAICLLALTSAPANGQTIAKFEIPFQFVAGDQVLPAGEYRVTVDSALRRIELRQVGQDSGAHLVAVPQHLDRAANSGKLIFNGYGTTRVLQSMQIGGRCEGVELPPSKAGREMVRAAQTTMYARTKIEITSAQ